MNDDVGHIRALLDALTRALHVFVVAGHRGSSVDPRAKPSPRMTNPAPPLRRSFIFSGPLVRMAFAGPPDPAISSPPLSDRRRLASRHA